jgi:hypothetical protein
MADIVGLFDNEAIVNDVKNHEGREVAETAKKRAVKGAHREYRASPFEWTIAPTVAARCREGRKRGWLDMAK